MATPDRNINADQPEANAISDGLHIPVVSEFVSARDYGFYLSSYFGDGAVEMVNFRVQGKN
ncbi:hypothetical protein [Paraburkholderia bannensis]|uniref:hypothetical protein n=1 Tax=Paraburkholderia bannensis TaxID=765414 RepID=UPI002AC32702|nr:hypothetical protein [Paraburkholderia bannensis]